MNWWEILLTILSGLVGVGGLTKIIIVRMNNKHNKNENEENRKHEIIMTYLTKCDVKDMKMFIKDKYGIKEKGMIKFNQNKNNLKKWKKSRNDRGQKNE